MKKYIFGITIILLLTLLMMTSLAEPIKCEICPEGSQKFEYTHFVSGSSGASSRKYSYQYTNGGTVYNAYEVNPSSALSSVAEYQNGSLIGYTYYKAIKFEGLTEGHGTFTCLYDGKEIASFDITVGHIWDEAQYTWGDNDLTVHAVRYCTRDASHKEEEDVQTIKTETPATCEESGKIIYTAKFTNPAFSTQTKEYTSGNPLGHKWKAEYTWSADYSSVTATATCENNTAHKETETVKTVRDVTVEPTATTEGKAIYTATFTKSMFTKQTKEVTLPQLDSGSEGSSGGESNPGTGSDPGAASDPGTGSNPGTGSDPGTQQPEQQPEQQSDEQITLKKLKSVKLKAVSKKKIQVSWKKLSSKDRKKIKKIQIQVSTDPEFKTILKEKFVSSKKTSYTVSGLKKNTKYYIRVRAYTEKDGIKNVSEWVKKSKKTKKK